jgi:C-terminal processing protease CtpA/Prc
MHSCQHLALIGLVSGFLICPQHLNAGTGNAPVTDEQQKFSTLFAQLGSDSFPIRQVAQQKLQEAASQNRELILEESLNQYFQSNDPEVRYRLRSAMFGIVGSTLRKEGFIGIRMMDAPIQFLNNKANPQPARAVQILSVLPGTAASKAGLRQGDKIIRLDGKAFDNNAPAYFELSKYIRAKSSGDTVKLSIKRGIQEIELGLELGARPEGIDEDRRARAFSEWMDQQKIARGIIKPATEHDEDPQQAPPGNSLRFPVPSIPIIPAPNPDKRK